MSRTKKPYANKNILYAGRYSINLQFVICIEKDFKKILMYICNNNVSIEKQNIKYIKFYRIKK